MDSDTVYEVLTVVYEERTDGNGPFERLEQLVNTRIKEGWQPLGGIAISATVGPKVKGGNDNWFLRVAQAMIRTAQP